MNSIMWVERTPEDLARAKRKRQSARFAVAVFAGLVFAVVHLFVEHHRYVTTYIPLDQVGPRVSGSVFIGVIVGIVVYSFWGKGLRKQNSVCPQCDKLKPKDGISQCECGGRFRNADEMKWIDDEK
ncbi:MAG: hypothetical protein ABSH19_04005 [Opitutales bacterium]|jgi:hypothetical protein